jgi:hypothetical protein
VSGAVERSEIMYVIREVLNCNPGKVRQMIEKFRSISAVLNEIGEAHVRTRGCGHATRKGYYPAGV